MKSLLRGRTVCLLLVGLVLAGAIAILSASAPVLTIERAGDNHVLLTWTNEGPGFVLQGMNPLAESGQWQTVPEAPQVLEGWLAVTLSVQSNTSQYFRLKNRGVAFTNHHEVLCWQTNGALDATLLLSADSIQDPFQLNWTISSNAVGATISPGGLVSLGTNAGSFTVTASTTNPAGEDSFALQTIKLEFATNAASTCWQSNGVFDAKALLTADSITNDSLLAWTITGTGPATIDGAGFVSFGSGPGSYLVQVTDRTNAVCAPSLVLDVLRLEFVTNAATVCWQSNGTFNARALLTSDSTTNDSLLAWTMTGTGPASIDSAGLVSVGSTSGSYTVQVAGRSNGVCAVSLALDVIKLALVTNAATVCWQSNGVFDAKALLTSDSITNDSLLAWTISGTGPASIDSTGLVSFGPGPGSYLVQVTDLSNQVCVSSLALDVLRLEFATNAITVCWQSNGTFNARALLTSDSTTNDSIAGLDHHRYRSGDHRRGRRSELGFRLGQLHGAGGRAEQRGMRSRFDAGGDQARTGQPGGDGVLAVQRGL